MECSKISDFIMKYIDGDISEVELKMLNRHMLYCEDCRREFQILTEMSKCISELPEVEAPASLEAKVMARIKQQRTQSSMLSMLLGAAGLFVFAYYMAIFAILPFFRELGTFQMMLSYGNYFLKLIGGYITKIIVYLPITIENLLILRNILIRDYMNVMLLIAGGVMLLNLELIKFINLQQE